MRSLFIFFLSGVYFVSASVLDSRNWKISVKSLRSSAVFRGRLKCPSPCCIRSAPGRDGVRGLSETSKKGAIFLDFGRYTPELFLDLGIVYLCLERKKHKGKHVLTSKLTQLISKLAF